MDSVMYAILLAVCASNSLHEEAESYFNCMKDECHSPNLYHYSLLLNAYSSGGNYEKADELVQEMKSSGKENVKVDFLSEVADILITGNIDHIIKVYVRGGLFDKSRELLAELDTLGCAEDELIVCKPNHFQMPYCLLMDGLAMAGRLDEVFSELREKSVKSDGDVHSIMISAFCRSELFEEVRQLAKDFEAKFDKYDLVLLNTMLCAYCRAVKVPYKLSVVFILFLYVGLKVAFEILTACLQGKELCSSFIFHLSKIRAHSEALFVYNMLRYSKRTMCKALHEKILHILTAGGLLKDAYVVVKDNSGSISRAAVKKTQICIYKVG
ncbi:hypothetical protein Pint_33504 [Pistacia integerrima]|uniref:Uncharacterized protein n=1 Tax=Pistacia integerrima TaxID=434235 RepID=A0ACC0X742_9ROSI|nr:hypothetical protein Pint_33504 [Pistacia integerrima]